MPVLPSRRPGGAMTVRRALLAVLLALVALVTLATTARADGDPGSDVLVYQNLFVAADANVSVQQQLELGNLLSSADKAGFPIRVAVVSQPNDLGAITALWQKPAAYASFLGTELSLAYAQRLLIVMPNGFGFNWQGHSATAAYQAARRAAHRSWRSRAWPRPPRARSGRSPRPRASGSPANPPPASGASGSAAGGTAAGAVDKRRRGTGAQPAPSRRPRRTASAAHRPAARLPLIAGIALAVAGRGRRGRLARRCAADAACRAAAAEASLRLADGLRKGDGRRPRHLARGRVRRPCGRG